MTLNEIIKDVLDRTIDPNGHVASYAIRRGGRAVGYLEARLEGGAGWSPMDRRMRWIISRPSASGQALHESSDDVRWLVARLGEVEFVPAMTNEARGARQCACW